MQTAKQRSACMKASDVAVIGGGVMGTSIAYFLAKRGVENVIVFEKNQIASGATGRSLGGVRNLFSHPLNVGLMNQNVAFFRELQSHLGEAITYHQTGYLYLLRNQAVRKAWEGRLDTYDRAGVDVDFLTTTETTERVPMVDTSDVEGAFFGRDCGFIDPHRTNQAFARAATDAGVTIRTGTAVLDVETASGEVQALVTEENTYKPDVVVNAAGPWVDRVASLAGVSLPVDNVQSGYLVMEATEARNTPLIIDETTAIRFRADVNGEMLVGLEKKPVDGPDEAARITQADKIRTLEAACEVVPALEDLDITGHWTGILTTTPDGHPVLGETAVDGFYVAGGFSGHGLMMAPIVSQALADQIVTGSTDLFAIDALGPNRFEKPDRIEPEEKSTSTA